MQGAQPRKNLAAWLMGFFLVVLGAKLWTIQIGATNIPYWDQWDEARLLFKPWLEGTLTWHDFFIPHNEHRIAFTRALDLLEVKLNGQWDPVLQMVVNAVIHIIYGGILATLVWICAGRKHAGLICCGLLPFFALPFAAENTTHGFQSQMYFLGIFSVLAILGLGFPRTWGGIWILGLLAAVAAVFTMASGFLAALAVSGLMLLRAFEQRQIKPHVVATFLAGAAVTGLGLWLKVDVAQHHDLLAQSFTDFLGVLSASLAWPFSQWPMMALVLNLPLLALLWKYFQPECQHKRAAEFVLTIGLWGLLQVMALAYGRAVLADSSRYLDTLNVIPIANFAALFVLRRDYYLGKVSKKVGAFCAVAWGLLVLTGLGEVSCVDAQKYLSWSRTWGLVETENVRAFMATDDADWLHSKMKLAVPYWNADWLIDLLRQPKIRSIMPADAQKSLGPEINDAASTGFIADGCARNRPAQPFVAAWGNSLTNSKASAGQFVSLTMTSSLPILSVQVYQGTGYKKIRLVTPEKQVTELHPQFNDRWETLIVDAPRGPFTLEIDQVTTNAPVAVGEIKQLGRGSLFAQSAVNHAVLILLIGLGLLLVFTVTGVTRPGITLMNEGMAWLLVLLVILTSLAGVIFWRDFDAAEYAFDTHQRLAVEFAHSGSPSRAILHLREALWLKPDEIEIQNTIAALQTRAVDDPLPEKTQ